MSKVVLVRCENYEEKELRDAIEKGIKFLGGIDNLINKGSKVLLKPNLLAAEFAERSVTTHPLVFSAISKLLKDYGCNISYGDSPGVGKASNVAKKCGIYEVAKNIGVDYVDFDEPISVQYTKGIQNKTFTVAKPIVESDFIISLPKLKTHALTAMTGAVKNQFGCIPGFRKAQYHLKLPDVNNFSKMLLDLNAFISPGLYIMDAIFAMEGNGPRSGNPRKLNVLLFSTDAVALDYIASSIISIDFSSVPTIKYGFELGYSNREEIEILGDDIESFKVYDFKKSHKSVSLGRNFLSFIKHPIIKKILGISIPKPVINKDKCVRCGVCVEVCPVTPNALNFNKNGKNYPPKYYYSKCISCYCCQELCPHMAISLKRRF